MRQGLDAKKGAALTQIQTLVTEGEEGWLTIKAALVREEGQPFAIDEIDLDEPRPNEVVVRVISSGICHTDLVTRDGYYGSRCPVCSDMKGLALSNRSGPTVRQREIRVGVRHGPDGVYTRRG